METTPRAPSRWAGYRRVVRAGYRRISVHSPRRRTRWNIRGRRKALAILVACFTPVGGYFFGLIRIAITRKRGCRKPRKVDGRAQPGGRSRWGRGFVRGSPKQALLRPIFRYARSERKSVGRGMGVSVRVGLGGGRSFTKKKC